MSQSNRNESMKEKVYSVILNRIFTMKTLYMKFAKKYLLSFLIVHLYLIGSATNYYVSNSGNDSNTGLSPDKAWQTLTKVNSVTFKAGDQILFEKGSTFYGTLKVSNSGAAGSPIVYGAYGTGANPVITGFTNVTSWTNLGSNIWESTNTVSTLVTCNVVLVNGVKTPMGRTPNLGVYYTIDSHTSNTSVTSSGLTGSPDWSGANIVNRIENWAWRVGTISSQSGSTLYYSDGTVTNPKDGNGFFIQNDPKTLDTQNEWYYNPTTKKIRIYSTSEPTNVKVSTIEYGVVGYNKSYFRIENLQFTGFNTYGAFLNTFNNVNISNCIFNNIGSQGINSYATNNYVIDNNLFKNCGLTAISSNTSCNYETITNNSIDSTNMIIGATTTSEAGAITAKADISIIQYNTIDHSGYDGIYVTSQHGLVKNNFVNHSLLTAADGGGIYTAYANTALKIESNIAMNSYGYTGATRSVWAAARGIYLDEGTTNVTVLNNTVAFNGTDGIFLNDNTHFNIISGNLSFSNERSQFAIQNLSSGGSLPLSKNSVVNNILFANGGQYTLLAQSYVNDIPTFFETATGNFYVRPIDDNLTIYAYQPDQTDGGKKTLQQWQTFSKQDINSHKSPFSISSSSDLRLEFNATNFPKIITLSYPMIDVTGKKYTSIDTLKPYTSVVLLKDPNPAISYTEHIAICQGTSYNGWTTTGTYTRTLKAKSGADSIVTTVLTVNPTYTINEAITIQSGEKYNGWTKTGTYTRTLSTAAGCDSMIITNLTVDSVAVKLGEVLPTHFISVWQNQTAITPMTIKVVAATKDDLPLAINDEIALYSGSLCVGSLKLTQPIDSANKSTFISIPASLNDGSGNGFTNNDTIIVKIWDDANHREMVVQNIRYLTDDASWLTTGRYSANATSVIEFKSYTEITQTISLVKGYNMMSTFVSADNPNVSNVTKPLTDSGALVKVQDEYGNSYENWGSYGGWVNNLGNLKSTEGYKIKVAMNCVLKVTGQPILLPLDITLNAGWNIISFPHTDIVNAMNVIQPLIDQNKLVKIQDEQGNSIEDWGAFGGWVNGIGNFIPGKAYKVKVNSNTSLTIR